MVRNGWRQKNKAECVRSVANEAGVWLELRVEWPGGKPVACLHAGGGGEVVAVGGVAGAMR